MKRWKVGGGREGGRVGGSITFASRTGDVFFCSNTLSEIVDEFNLKKK